MSIEKLTPVEKAIQKIIYDNWPADRNTYRSAVDIAQMFQLNEKYADVVQHSTVQPITFESEVTDGITALAEAVHKTAVDHGWWDINEDGSRNMGEMIALMHSELSEALESWRDNEPTLHYKYAGYAPARYELSPTIDGILGKPCGLASEFADVIIRILDTCERMDIPIARALIEKNAYNQTRPYRHGGKLA